jgi:hypothetical protein
MSIRLYERMKQHYNEVKPIRGRNIEVRPWGERRRDWEQVICRVQDDGQCAYGARMHSTDVLLVMANGDVLFSCGGWATPTTAAFMNGLTGEFYVSKTHNRIWIRRSVGTEHLCAVLDQPVLVKWDTTNPNYEHYRLAEPSTAMKKVVDPIKAKAERAKIKPFKDYVSSVLKLSDGRLSHELTAQYMETINRYWEESTTFMGYKLSRCDMHRLTLSETEVKVLSLGMESTDPDEQLELFPHLLVMFTRGCDIKEQHPDHDKYDPKQVLGKLDRFVTKYKDVYVRKEVVITAPIKLD